MIDSWLWVIGGGQLQVPVVEEAHLLGLKVLVTDMNPVCICSEYADRFEPVDIFDIDANLQLCRDLQNEGMQIAGVLAAGIDAPVTMAKINESLGLKGISSKTAYIIQQKDLFRQAMLDKGFPVPRFGIVKNIVESHSGRIQLENRSTGGTRAIVNLPVILGAS